jgi:uncharacterized protein YodC (DUF2158 family)
MSTIKDGGPAFPVPGLQHDEDFNGMSLRDYFAAKAMQGFAADPNAAWTAGANGMARCAYDWADAMLKAREGGAA